MNPAPQSQNTFNDLNYNINISKNLIPENVLGPEFLGNDIQFVGYSHYS